MTTLYERLLARIGELERIARACLADAPTPWTVTRGVGVVRIIRDHSGIAICSPVEADAEHIAAWDPATVLRGLAEDRDILQRHPHSTHGGDLFCGACGWVGGPGPDGDLARLAGVEPGGWIGERGCPEVLSLARRHGVEVTS